MHPEDLEWFGTRVMPSDKHKGRAIAELPGNDLNWFSRKGIPPRELGRLLALMQEINHNWLNALSDPNRARIWPTPA
jgi:uncharacterized protein